MLPDFPCLKNRVNRQLLLFVKAQIPVVTPLLRDVSSFVQHEGVQTAMTRADDSHEAIDYARGEFKFTIPTEEMRTFDMDALRTRLVQLAEQIGEHQSKLMLARISEAAESVGNTINANGEFKPEHLLDILRKVHVDFDPTTGKRRPGFSWVMHPDTADKVLAKVSAWESDQDFRRELQRVEDEQREAWRAREARRKLAD